MKPTEQTDRLASPNERKWSGVYRLSTQNDGSWGLAGTTDAEVIGFCSVLAEMIAETFPGVSVDLVAGPVSRHQPGMNDETADEILNYCSDSYGEAIDRADRERTAS